MLPKACFQSMLLCMFVQGYNVETVALCFYGFKLITTVAVRGDQKKVTGVLLLTTAEQQGFGGCGKLRRARA